MKIGKRILGMMLAVVMACSLSISVFAMEPINESNEVVPVASSEIVITRDENGNITFETPDDAGTHPLPGSPGKCLYHSEMPVLLPVCTSAP